MLCSYVAICAVMPSIICNSLLTVTPIATRYTIAKNVTGPAKMDQVGTNYTSSYKL